MRADNRVLVTTPESLHYIFLPNSYKNWRQFFRHLRIVVLDEAHMYKGAFGSHVANIVRRLRVKCASCGNADGPMFVVSSATISNARELASGLLGLDADEFELIDASGAPQAPRHLLSAPVKTTDLCRGLADLWIRADGKRRRPKTIIFCRSIRGTGSLAGQLRRQLKIDGLERQAERVRTYYSKKKRPQQLFKEMEETDFLFTTNSLMAGIDIGELDVCIVEGFHGLIMDVRQMFGRAGRRNEGVSIFVGKLSDPFDSHYLQHPRQLFEGEPERAVVNPRNPLILGSHLLCAAQISSEDYESEGALPATALDAFGPTAGPIMQRLIEEEQIEVTRDSFVHEGRGVHNQGPLKSLRGITECEYQVCDADGRKLMERNEIYAYRDHHPGAIFRHEGTLYRVDRLDKDGQRIHAVPIDEEMLRTQGYVDVEVGLRNQDGTKEGGRNVRISIGEITLSQSVTQYAVQRIEHTRVCKTCDCEHPDIERKKCPVCGRLMRLQEERRFLDMVAPIVQDGEILDLSTTLDTVGCWLSIDKPLVDAFEREFLPLYEYSLSAPEASSVDIFGALSTVGNALMKTIPERILCDPRDLDGFALAKIGDSHTPHFLVYDNYPEGLGLAEEMYELWRDLLAGALERIEGCSCENDVGCPVCVSWFSAKYGNWGLSKLAARYLLHWILERDPSSILDELSGTSRD